MRLILTLALLIAAMTASTSKCYADANTRLPSTPDNAQLLRIAKEWFHRFQIEKIDRSQLNPETRAQLTAKVVHSEAIALRPFRNPTAFRFVGSQKIESSIGYNFLIILPNGRIFESIAFDKNGKISGISFQTFVPNDNP